MSQKEVKIIVKGEDKTKEIKSWIKNNDRITITYSNEKTYSYNKDNVKIETSVLSNNTALHCFNYLKSLSEVVGIKDESSNNNSLLNQYEKIDFLSDETMLSSFLIGKFEKEINIKQPFITIYPFGFNLSQKTAVDNALNNQLSIIEGPPGTGKTQTILNIIANAIINDESVAIVSSNNSATQNVFDKLKKYNLDFTVASLGSYKNKQKFIDEQKLLPNLLAWEITTEKENEIKNSLQNLSSLLSKMLSNKNELSKIQQELDLIELEYKHFSNYCSYEEDFIYTYLKPKSSDIALELWIESEKYIKNNKKPRIVKKFINKYFKGVVRRDFYSLPAEMIINICQKSYYLVKIKELLSNILILKNELENFDFDKKMKEYSSLSMEFLHGKLYKKYKDEKNKLFEIKDLDSKSEDIIKRYPVVLSTAYSLCNSLSNDIMYDYVIIDEASQVNLTTGALALSCAKKVVIVGDLKQLPNVVNDDDAIVTDNIFEKYNLSEQYRYKNNSILSSILEIFPFSARTLLREHYRCHPKIIDFCNKKFYNNELIILSEPKSSRLPLVVYKTTPGNHARSNVNQRQIDVIKNEIISQQNLENEDISIGIVTPYRKQTEELQKTFKETEIEADTVDKFQGRENDIIILSTVDNQIGDFTDNPNRLNVAVSRAIDQLIVVVHDNEETKDTNIKDLINYIKYNNLEIINSEIHSVFDYLYKGYFNKKQDILKNKKKISKYDSENLMHSLICDVLKENRFSKFDVTNHVSLKTLLRNTNQLEDDEKKYATNPLTHVDFLIFDKLGKIPYLAIEVDGVSYHSENSSQAKRDILKNRILEKYNIPLIRFKTNGSGEKEQLISELNKLMC